MTPTQPHLQIPAALQAPEQMPTVTYGPKSGNSLQTTVSNDPLADLRVILASTPAKWQHDVRTEEVAAHDEESNTPLVVQLDERGARTEQHDGEGNEIVLGALATLAQAGGRDHPVYVGLQYPLLGRGDRDQLPHWRQLPLQGTSGLTAAM